MKKDYETLKSRAVIAGWKAERDYTLEDMADLWKCGIRTVSRRISNPETLTVSEIRRMNLPESDVLRLVYGR